MSNGIRGGGKIMADDNNEPIVGPSAVLATFLRTNRETGAPEQLRITSGSFNGRELVHLRRYYRDKYSKAGEDSWLPSKVGETIREHELTLAIEALEEARRRAFPAAGDKYGTSLYPDPDLRQQEPRQDAQRPARRLPFQAKPKPTPPQPQRPVQNDAFDDLAEYRR
jgi:hypothetical protein